MHDTIQTQRLNLRPLAIEDAKALSKQGSDFDIARMTGSFPHPFPLLSAEFKIMDLKQKHQRGLAFPYAVTIDNGSMIGIVDLFRSNLEVPIETGLEIGYWIGRPFWGRGYATEACQGLIQNAVDTLKVRRIKAGVFVDNPASQTVLKKLGFQVSNTPKTLFFSMARMEKAWSLDMHLDIKNFVTKDPITEGPISGMRKRLTSNQTQTTPPLPTKLNA